MLQALEQTESRPLPDDYWNGELVPASDPRAGIISINSERMSGTPCFVGTRVPIKNLWDYLEVSGTLEEFLDDFEGVPREEVMAALRLSYQQLLDGLPEVTWDDHSSGSLPAEASAPPLAGIRRDDHP